LIFKKELVGVFGHPVAENPSAPMVQAAFDHHSLEWQYLTIEVARNDLRAAVEGARAMGMRGFNCTIPHKVDVCAYLDEIAPSATLIGAVNCVVRKGEKFVGENTDGKGLLEALNRVVSPKGMNIALIGAGGAARAIAVELMLAGVRNITLINRGEKRGNALVAHLMSLELSCHAEAFSTRFVPMEERFTVPPEADIVINATSVGLYPYVTDELPMDYSSLSSEMVVVDIIPNPPNTIFLERARNIGCATIDGLEMLVEQGRLGVFYWTGTMPDAAPMRTALRVALDR